LHISFRELGEKPFLRSPNVKPRFIKADLTWERKGAWRHVHNYFYS